MTILGFFGDLWKVLVQFVSLCSDVELLVIIGFTILFPVFLYFLGQDPKKYKDC